MIFALKQISLSFLYGNTVKMNMHGHIDVIYNHTDFYRVFLVGVPRGTFVSFVR